MIDRKAESRLFHFVLWFVAGCVIVILATSCSPLAAYEQIPTAELTATTEPILSITTEISPTPQTCTVATGVPAGYLNLRTGPGINHAVIRVLTEGEILKVIARGDWLKVVTRGNVTGFVNSKFCKERTD